MNTNFESQELHRQLDKVITFSSRASLLAFTVGIACVNFYILQLSGTFEGIEWLSIGVFWIVVGSFCLGISTFSFCLYTTLKRKVETSSNNTGRISTS